MTILRQLEKASWPFVAIFIFVLPLLGILVLCIDKVIKGDGQSAFRLGHVPIPKFMGAGATYMDVLILMVVAIFALAIGVYFSWRHYKEEQDFKKKYGIKEESSLTDNMLERLEENDDL